MFVIAGLAGIASYLIEYRNERTVNREAQFDVYLAGSDFFIAAVVGFLLMGVAHGLGFVSVPEDENQVDLRPIVAGIGGLFNRVSYEKGKALLESRFQKYDP